MKRNIYGYQDKTGVIKKWKEHLVKSFVSKSVQEAIWAYYREQETIVGSNMATLWALCGPKADVEGKNKLFVVSVESGFILPR